MISWGITPLYQVTMGKKMIFLCLHIQQGKQVSNGIHYHISPWYKAYIFLLPSNPKGLPRLFLRAGSSPDTIWKPENFVTGILPARFYWLLQSSIGGQERSLDFSAIFESVHMPKFNYFWTLSKMAEKSRDRSCSEPSN